ncbi:hypothetical protein [Kallotenue papyrolyticum]|uniref:hypothetical protein n=1 Tax=Kallotenue papyrolyticum TaxID=1325125 RepID=UPI0004785588|nr:hypothetical protein [Kallotenue papyrolyticum]
MADLLALLCMLAALLAGLMLAYTRPSGLSVGVVGLDDYRRIHYRAHLRDFHEPEAIAGQTRVSYRWTRDRSTIVAPGLGRGLWQTDLALASPVPAGQPKQALVRAGQIALPIQLQASLRHYHLLAPSHGDLNVVIESVAAHYGSDPRPLGVMFGGVQLQPVARVLLPPWRLLAHAALALGLMFATLRLLGLRPWVALALSLIGVALLALGIVRASGPVGLISLRLVALSSTGLLGMLALRWALPRLFRLGGVELQPQAWTVLLVLIYLSFLVRAVGLLWPYFLSVDIEWHMEKTQRVLSGRIRELWDATSPFHQSVMPEDEWGSNRPVIPYSPFYHIFSAIWAIFPWPLRLSAETYSAALDVLRAAMIAFVIRKIGLPDRAALVGALTYLILPATFLLHAWGNTPTTNGMWWSLLAITLLLGAGDRLLASGDGRAWSWWWWACLTAVLTATLLFYAVTAVFTGLLFAGVALALLLTRRWRAAWPILLSLATATLLSLAIYYWQFVPLIIERTLPRLTETAVTPGRTIGGQEVSFARYAASYLWLLDIYGLYLPLLLGCLGYGLALRRYGLSSLFGLTMSAWGTVALLFWLVGLKVSMVDKQLFWLMPWMAIGTAIAVERLVARRAVARWAVPLLLLGALYTGSDALYLWQHRVGGYGIGEGFTSWYQLLCRQRYDKATCLPLG